MDVTDLLLIRPEDMVLTLYLRPIHPEFFRIYSERSFTAPEYEADLWITGLGHVVTVRSTLGGRTAERCVTEIIGPDAVALPDRGRAELLHLHADQESSFILRNGFTYQLHSQVETIDDADVFAAIYDGLRNQGLKEGISCEYRLEGVQRKLWPLAMVVPTHTRGAFLLHAFHVFPDFRTILKTQTLIEVPKTKE